MKKLFGGLFAVLVLMASPVRAQSCTSFPYTLTNGTTADATQVMADFSYLGNGGCLAPLASPSFTGKVGINSTSPLNSLTVVGNTSSAYGYTATLSSNVGTSSAWGDQLNITNLASNWGLLAGYDGSGVSTSTYHGANAAYLINVTDGPLNLGANNGVDITIAPSGYVGIGTTAPTTGLTVVGHSSGDGATAALSSNLGTGSGNGNQLNITNSTSSWGLLAGFDGSGESTSGYHGPNAAYLVNVADGPLILGANNAVNMTINSSGNIGVGTTNPSSLLSLGTAINTIKLATYDGGSSGLYGIGVNASELTFGADITATGTPQMVLTSGGNVGIGTTSPSYLLQAGSTSASGIVFELQNSSGACTHSPTSSAETVSCSSDARLKKDIADASPALPWFEDMRIRDFTIRATGKQATGVIAQEMLKTHSDMVQKGPDGFYKVDEPNPWKLVQAIQELKAANDRLSDQLARRTAMIEGATRQIVGLQKKNALFRSRLSDFDRRLSAIETRADVHGAAKSAALSPSANSRAVQ